MNEYEINMKLEKCQLTLEYIISSIKDLYMPNIPKFVVEE